MSVGSPVMCVECGRQRMTGEQLYQLMQTGLAEHLASCPPRERHKYTGTLIHSFCERVHELATSEQWREFNDAMYAHGYHRHQVARGNR